LPKRNTKWLAKRPKRLTKTAQKAYKRGPKALQKRSTVLPSDIPFVELVEVDPVGAIAVEDGAES
jgi:hypothetical protein